MGITLKAAKPKLEQDLYKAFYDAYTSQFIQEPEAGKCNNIANESIDKAAKEFSNILAKGMSQAIYDFVMEIGIQANVSGVVIAPSGLCTGTIPMTNFTIS